MRVKRYDSGSKELVDLGNRKYICIVCYNGPDKCIYGSLVCLLA